MQMWSRFSSSTVQKNDAVDASTTFGEQSRKSFSLCEDDSRPPHFSPTLCQYNIRPFGLGGFRVASFSLFDLELTISR